MGKLLLLLLLAAAPAQGSAVWTENQVQTFCGLDTFHDSSKIADCDSQDVQNFLTDSGTLEKFPGMSRIVTEVLAGYPVKFLGRFVANSGTKFLLIQSSASIYSTTLGGSPTLLQLQTTDDDVDMVQAFGKAYFVNGVDVAWSFDGTSTAAVSAIPTCFFVEFDHERIYCGKTTTSKAQVSVSSFGGAGFWTVPTTLTADSPTSFNFEQNDGKPITCLAKTPYGIFVGKRNSIYIVKGYDNSTYYKRLVSPNIGCVDDRSIQMVDGRLTWLSLEGIYSWDGSGPPALISGKIEPTVLSIRQLNSVLDSWMLTTEIEWETGTFGTNGPSNVWDSDTITGTLMPSSFTFVDTSSANFGAGLMVGISTRIYVSSITLGPNMGTQFFLDDFEDGGFGENPTWTEDQAGWAIGSAVAAGGRVACRVDATETSASESNGIRVSSNVTPAGRWGIKLFRKEVTISGGVTLFRFKFISDPSSGDGYALEAISNNVNPSDGSNMALRLVRRQSGSDVLISSQAINMAPTTSSTHTFQVERSTVGVFRVLSNNGAAVLFSGYDYELWPGTSQVKVSLEGSVSGCGDPKIGVDSVTIAGFQSAGYMQSQVWDMKFSTPVGGPFLPSTTTPTGTTMSFMTRSGAAAAGPFSAWVAISTGGRVVEQGRYWQWQSSFTTTIGTVTPEVGQVPLEATSTGYYYSPVQFIGTAISSWSTVDFTDEALAGRVAYAVRATTYSFAEDATLPAWTAHTNHTRPAISTGSYVQERIGAFPGSTSDTVRVNSSIWNWQEGTEKRVSSVFIDHRYFLCVSISTSGNVNDQCLVLQKNGEWTVMTGKNIDSLALYDDYPVAGSGDTDSNVWRIMDPNAKNFDVTIQTSTWVSKDFVLGEPFQNKILHGIWTEADYSASSTLTIGYAIGKSDSYTQKTIALDSTANFSNKFTTLDSGYTISKYLRFRFYNAGRDHSLKLNGYSFMTETEPMTQD